MFRCPNCGSSMETDDENDADYVVIGHVVCGRICYDAFAEKTNVSQALLFRCVYCGTGTTGSEVCEDRICQAKEHSRQKEIEGMMRGNPITIQHNIGPP